MSPFLIAKLEVTQGEWVKAVSSLPSQLVRDDASEFRGENFPVVYVSWEECLSFCANMGFKLPTEAQWEYACRAGTETAYCFGNDPVDLIDYGWYFRNSGKEMLPEGTSWKLGQVLGEWDCRPHPVGKKKPNDFGLHDMHGNVWEWCQDVFDESLWLDQRSRRT